MRRDRAARRWLLRAAVAVANWACSSFFGLCRIELIEVYFPATIVENDAAPRIVNLRGGMSPSDLNEGEFNALRAMLVSGSTDYEGAHWGADGFGPESGLGIALPTPFEPGRVITISGTVEVPDARASTTVGWRPIALPDGTGRVGLRMAGFEAVSAVGTAEVLAVRPLQLRFDILLLDAAGRTVRIQGVMEVVYTRSTADCS